MWTTHMPSPNIPLMFHFLFLYLVQCQMSVRKCQNLILYELSVLCVIHSFAASWLIVCINLLRCEVIIVPSTSLTELFLWGVRIFIMTHLVRRKNIDLNQSVVYMIFLELFSNEVKYNNQLLFFIAFTGHFVFFRDWGWRPVGVSMETGTASNTGCQSPCPTWGHSASR